MKHFNHLWATIALVMAGLALSSCHSDLDLGNVDPRAEVEMGVALPIGSLHATIGDFFGAGVGDFYVDTIEEKDGGHPTVITWKKAFDIERNFHADSLDLTNMVSSKELTLDVYDKLPEFYEPSTTNKMVIGTGTPMTLDFEMPVKLKGINKELGGDRLDSALIEMARFTSNINTYKGLPLEWDWIDEVTLDLGKQVNRPENNIMTVYKKGEEGGYGADILTDIDAFTICLMKNRDLDPSQWSLYEIDNVIDSCTFFIHFTFTIPDDTTVYVPKDAGFNYNLNVEFIRYTAIWGKFVPSSDMHDEDTILISDYLGGMDLISKWNLPFTDPKIDMHVITHIAGALVLKGDYLYAQDADHNPPTYAKFYSSKQHDFQPTITKSQYLPLSSDIGESTNIVIPFNNTPEGGRIDELFQKMPQMLAYRFNVDFNYQETPQIRITPNTSIRINAVTTLPMIFNEGLHVEYSDTITDLNLSQYSIDSLVNSVQIIDTLKATDINMVLHAKNQIPLDVKAYMRCLDEYGNIIKDPTDNTKPLLLFKEDTVKLQAPNFVKAGGSFIPEPGETTILASLSKAELNMLPKIKQIAYYAFIDDDSMAGAYAKGMSNIRLTEDQGLTIKIGISANVDAVLDFTQTNTTNNQ